MTTTQLDTLIGEVRNARTEEELGDAYTSALPLARAADRVGELLHASLRTEKRLFALD